MGEVEYKRRIYKNGKKYVFLLDKELEISTVGNF